MIMTAAEASTCSLISLFSYAFSGQKKMLAYKKDHPMASDPSSLILSNILCYSEDQMTK